MFVGVRSMWRGEIALRMKGGLATKIDTEWRSILKDFATPSCHIADETPWDRKRGLKKVIVGEDGNEGV